MLTPQHTLIQFHTHLWGPHHVMFTPPHPPGRQELCALV